MATHNALFGMESLERNNEFWHLKEYILVVKKKVMWRLKICSAHSMIASDQENDCYIRYICVHNKIQTSLDLKYDQ